MIKYYCDHCDKEVEVSEVLRFTVACRKTGYFGFKEVEKQRKLRRSAARF